MDELCHALRSWFLLCCTKSHDSNNCRVPMAKLFSIYSVISGVALREVAHEVPINEEQETSLNRGRQFGHPISLALYTVMTPRGVMNMFQAILPYDWTQSQMKSWAYSPPLTVVPECCPILDESAQLPSDYISSSSPFQTQVRGFNE